MGFDSVSVLWPLCQVPWQVRHSTESPCQPAIPHLTILKNGSAQNLNTLSQKHCPLSAESSSHPNEVIRWMDKKYSPSLKCYIPWVTCENTWTRGNWSHSIHWATMLIQNSPDTQSSRDGGWISCLRLEVGEGKIDRVSFGGIVVATQLWHKNHKIICFKWSYWSPCGAG